MSDNTPSDGVGSEFAASGGIDPKQLQALAANGGAGTSAGGGATGPGGLPAGFPGGGAPGAAAAPREVGTLAEELVKRPLHDVASSVAEIFSLKRLLDIKDQPDPKKSQQQKALHSRFNQLSQEEQAVAQERFQREAQRKQRLAEEDAISAQQKQQKTAQSAVMPGGKGGDPATQSKHQAAMDQLKKDRTTNNTIQSAG